jgi:hypothetical protein
VLVDDAVGSDRGEFCARMGEFGVIRARHCLVLFTVDEPHSRCQLGERDDVEVDAAVAVDVLGAEVDQVLGAPANEAGCR